MSIFDDIYDAGKSVVDKAGDAAREAVSEIEVLGEGVVDGAELIGDAFVDGATMLGDKLVAVGEGATRWTLSAAGDVVEWSKTSYAEVAEWTENAAGDVANFTVEGYQAARGALETAGAWIYEQLLNYFYETLPKLGGLDPKAREVATYLLSEPVARGVESLADVAGCVITFGIKLKAVSSLNIGIYACGGGWGFFLDSRFDSLQSMISSPSLGVGVAAQVTMIFGPVSRASGAKALKFGLGMKSNPAKKLSFSIGGVVLMEAAAPPLFLGVRYAMELDVDLFGKQKSVDEAGKLKWKVKIQPPKPNGEFATDALGVVGDVAEIGWEDLTTGLSAQATNFDAALRAQNDPATADRVQATALAAAMSPFKPRYFGAVRTLKGQTVVGTSQGAVGVGIAGDRSTVNIVAGLTDPAGVSFEVVGEPPLYWCAQANGDVTLVPYNRTLDLTGTTFRMVRGLGGQGVSFAVSADGAQNPRFLVATRVRGGIVTPTPVFCAERMIGIEAPTREDATFLLDRPVDQPEALGPVLRPGQFLRLGEAKRSPNGLYSLLLADNGRLAMRRRGNSSLNSPSAWLIYEPGVIQDASIPWAWASPTPATPGPYHAYVTHDGRLTVRAGADPEHAGATLWQSDVRGAPGPCFLAITNEGAAVLMRGTPEAPGELVWSSITGAQYWSLKRRQVVLQFQGKWVRANNGGGVNTPGAPPQPQELLLLDGATVGGWEAFELQELGTGHVALRAQGRRYVGLQDNGPGVVCLRDQIGPRELFTAEVLSGGNGQPQVIRLKSAATGGYLRLFTITIMGVTTPGALSADGSAGNAAVFVLYDVEHDLTAHTGRLVHIVAKHSGKALEVPCGYNDDGRGLVQGELLGAEHQKWIMTHVGGGWFTLTNRQTGKTIDIAGGSTANGAVALQWPLHAGNNQRFALTPTGDGTYYITAKHSTQALDVEAGSAADGARVLQWPLHGGNNQRWTITLAPAGPSSPWTALGGGLASEVGVASAGPGRLDVFARGLDDAMWQIGANGSWRTWWGSHGGGFFNDPAVVAQTATRLDVFARGKDNAVYQRWWAGGNTWQGWTSLGGSTAATPVALAPRPGRWDIFILGTDKAIWHRYADNGWSPWISLGGGLLDPPAALLRDGYYYLFARGLDNCLYQNTTKPDGGWWGWNYHGGGFAGRMAAVSIASGCFDVFGRGTDGCLWQRSFRNGAWSWVKLDGQLGSDPAVISIAPDRIDVLVRGSDGNLWHRRWTGKGWLAWARLGNLQIVGRPAVTSSAPRQVDVMVVGADKAVRHYRLDG